VCVCMCVCVHSGFYHCQNLIVGCSACVRVYVYVCENNNNNNNNNNDNNNNNNNNNNSNNTSAVTFREYQKRRISQIMRSVFQVLDSLFPVCLNV